jgi:3-phenylpropionate/trans-cinnamate dioxygenase ferredoxin subunit
MAFSSFVRALKVSDLPPGTKKAIDIAGNAVLICNADGRLFAISKLCSHALEKLECGRMSKSGSACPLHGARFELATGRAMNPPAVSHQDIRYPTCRRVDRSGGVSPKIYRTRVLISSITLNSLPSGRILYD